jgi:butyrate response factor 1
MGKTLDSPASSCVSDGRYVSPSRVSEEKECEAREAERLLRAIAERYDECFLRLRDATAEVADLRLERLHLRAENVQLSLLLEELEANQGNQAYAAAPTAPPKPADEAAAARGGAPKSISIRSKCYLSQMKQPHGEADAQRLRVRPPPPVEVTSYEFTVQFRRESLDHLLGTRKSALQPSNTLQLFQFPQIRSNRGEFGL